MKRHVAPALFALAVSAAAPRALATWYATTYRYDVHFDFSAVAWDKPVTAVYAHTGVLEASHDASSGRTETYWADVKHVPLRWENGRFTGEAQVTGQTGGGSGAVTVQNRGAVVQYWVTFADGSSRITDVFPVPVRRAAVAPGDWTSATCLETPYLAPPREC